MAPFVRRGHLAVRWTARIFAAVLLALVAAIAIGQGIPNFLEVTAVEGILFLAFAIMLVGLLMGFRWEIQGGVLILMGLSVFYAMNFAASGKLPGGAFPLFFVPGTLYLLSGLLGRKDRGAQPLAG